MVLLMTPLSLPVAVAVWQWQWPSAMTWLLLLALGGMGTVGHLLFTNALKMTDVSIMMPFDFARLPLTIVLAWLLFEQEVDQWAIISAMIVFASGAYIAHREAKLRKS